jgi:hypothetical protein
LRGTGNWPILDTPPPVPQQRSWPFSPKHPSTKPPAACSNFLRATWPTQIQEEAALRPGPTTLRQRRASLLFNQVHLGLCCVRHMRSMIAAS